MSKIAAPLLLIVLAACQPPAAPPPAPSVATVPDRRLLLTINFDFDSHTIRPTSYPQLDYVAVALNDERLRGVRFDINGHTDIIGRLGYNIALSQLRADAVMDYLMARGVPPDVMHPQGFGPLALLDKVNPTNPANRRVEIVAIGP
jgi:outer membrane protein OmpA-like peptidoglycan-associated protein